MVLSVGVPPEFEHEEGVEALGVVKGLAVVFVDELSDGGGVEVGGGE